MDIPQELQGLTMPELLVALSQYFGDDVPDDIGCASLSPKIQANRRTNEARKLVQKLTGNMSLRIYVPKPEEAEAFNTAFENTIPKRNGSPNWSATARYFDLDQQHFRRYAVFRLNTEPGNTP